MIWFLAIFLAVAGSLIFLTGDGKKSFFMGLVIMIISFCMWYKIIGDK